MDYVIYEVSALCKDASDLLIEGIFACCVVASCMFKVKNEILYFRVISNIVIQSKATFYMSI